jgi:hypothetical protein
MFGSKIAPFSGSLQIYSKRGLNIALSFFKKMYTFHAPIHCKSLSKDYLSRRRHHKINAI